MNRILIFFLLSVVFITSCQTTKPFEHRVIRYNYFDSSNYRLSAIDTNVNYDLYKDIFKNIRFDNSTKCLLMKVSAPNVVWEEYGLYDYGTQKFSYCSIDRKLYLFKETNTPKSKLLYERMEEFIKNKEPLDKYVKGKKQLFDGADIEVDLITVNNKSEVIVKSYHW